MNKIKFVLCLSLVILLSFCSGYILHESKDQIEIYQEAQSIIIERSTFNLTESNISICGSEFNE